MTRNGVIENYEQWLMVQVQVNAETHGKLCHILQDTAFEPIVEMDENRSEDGIRACGSGWNTATKSAKMNLKRN